MHGGKIHAIGKVGHKQSNLRVHEQSEMHLYS